MNNILLYILEDQDDRRQAMALSLVSLVNKAQAQGLNNPEDYLIYGITVDLQEILLTPETYCRNEIISRTEAEAFVQERLRIFREATIPRARAAVRLWGCLRANINDPVEQQVEDYLQTANKEWLTPRELIKQELQFIQEGA